jgi:beta-phosphoglucomutase-like phosphatase (HAD superfamily)
MTRAQYDALLFDLDGVNTDTANLHAACWKQMFDGHLETSSMQTGEKFRSFDATDYLLYVDGKPRFGGVRDFLKSRSIQIPEGTPDDPSQAETVGGLGNRTNDLVNKVIGETGVLPYNGSVKLIHQLRSDGFKIAVVTSSHNCDTVLRATKFDAFFEVSVDGNVIRAQHLTGKPAPHLVVNDLEELVD